MTKPPQHFYTRKDIDAYIKRRVNRTTWQWVPLAIALVLLAYWAENHGLGAVLEWLIGGVDQLFGTAAGTVFALVIGPTAYVVLPCLPSCIISYRCERTLKKRARNARCVSCGYDLSAVADQVEGDRLTCSECGASYAMTIKKSFPDDVSAPASE